MEWKIEVKHINVQQGDAALLLVYNTPTGKPELVRSILLDGGDGARSKGILNGGDPEKPENMGNFAALYSSIFRTLLDNKLDAIILTHDDFDHIDGIKNLFASSSLFPSKYLDRTFFYDQGVIRKGKGSQLAITFQSVGKRKTGVQFALSRELSVLPSIESEEPLYRLSLIPVFASFNQRSAFTGDDSTPDKDKEDKDGNVTYKDDFLTSFLLGHDLLWNFADFQILTYEDYSKYEKLWKPKMDIDSYKQQVRNLLGQDAFSDGVEGTNLSDLRETLSKRDKKRFEAIVNIIKEMKKWIQWFVSWESDSENPFSNTSLEEFLTKLETAIKAFNHIGITFKKVHLKKLYEILKDKNNEGYQVLKKFYEEGIYKEEKNQLKLLIDFLQQTKNSISLKNGYQSVRSVDLEPKTRDINGEELLMQQVENDLILYWAVRRGRKRKKVFKRLNMEMKDVKAIHQKLANGESDSELIKMILSRYKGIKTDEYKSFLNNAPYLDKLQQIGDLQLDQIKSIETDYMGKPLLLCVSVNEEPLQKTGVLMLPMVVPTKVTAQNRRSIATILLSPSNEILHYLGGDLTEIPEQKLAKWLTSQNYNGSKRVPCMKLSHHGSRGSTPFELLYALSPEYTIISAGLNSSYYHPHPDILYLIDAFNENFDPVISVATNYPLNTLTSREAGINKDDYGATAASKPLENKEKYADDYESLFVDFKYALEDGVDNAHIDKINTCIDNLLSIKCLKRPETASYLMYVVNYGDESINQSIEAVKNAYGKEKQVKNAYIYIIDENKTFHYAIVKDHKAEETETIGTLPEKGESILEDFKTRFEQRKGMSLRDYLGENPSEIIEPFSLTKEDVANITKGTSHILPNAKIKDLLGLLENPGTLKEAISKTLAPYNVGDETIRQVKANLDMLVQNEKYAKLKSFLVLSIFRYFLLDAFPYNSGKTPTIQMKKDKWEKIGQPKYAAVYEQSSGSEKNFYHAPQMIKITFSNDATQTGSNLNTCLVEQELGYAISEKTDQPSKKKRQKVNVVAVYKQSAQTVIDIKRALFLSASQTFRIGRKDVEGVNYVVAEDTPSSPFSSAFFDFFKDVPEQCLVVSVSSFDKSAPSFSLKGTVVNQWAKWLREFDVTALEVDLQAQWVGDDQKTIAFRQPTDFIVNASLSWQSLTSAPSSMNPIALRGVLTRDRQLVLSVNTDKSDKPIVLNIFTTAQQVGFIDAASSAFFQDLMAALLNSPSTFDFPLDTTQTKIVYTPSANNSVFTQWVQDLSDIQILKRFQILKQFQISKTFFALVKQSSPLTTEHISHQLSCWFDTTFVLHKIPVEVRVSLSQSGNGVFTVEQHMDLQQLAEAFDVNLEGLDKLGLELNPIESVTVNFDLLPAKINFFSITSSVVFKSLSLDITLLLPQKVIMGQLSIGAKGKTQLKDFLSRYDNGNSQKITPPDAQLAAFPLAEVDFTADFSNQVYSLTADLEDESGALWSFGNLKISEVGLALNKMKDEIEINLSGSFYLGETYVNLLGYYDRATDGKATWGFSATISNIPITDLVELYTSQDLKDYLPNLGLKNIEINFTKQAEVSWSLQAEVYIDAITLNVNANWNTANKDFTIEWHASDNEELGLNTLISALQMPMTLPDILDIALQSATFTYDFNQKTLFFSATMTYGKIDLLFYKDKQSPPKTQSIAILGIQFPPTLSGVPLIGSLPQPLESIQLLLSSADVKATDRPAFLDTQDLGLLAIDINQGVQLVASIRGTQPIVLQLPSTQSSTPRVPVSTEIMLAVPTANVNDSSSSPIKWVSVQRSLGPLTLKRVGVGYQSRVVSIALDAGFSLGGLTIELQGFSIGLSLQDLTKLPTFNLDGLGIGFSVPALTIGGDFFRDSSFPKDIGTRYEGALVVGVGGFSIAAIGAYTQLKSGDVSVFMFAEAASSEGFGGPPAFYITGFTGGFGVNSQLELPNQDEVTNFPLVQGISTPVPGNNLLDRALNTLTQLTSLTTHNPAWVSERVGEYWLAAGVEFTTYELLFSNVLVVADFGHDFQLALLGRTYAQLPPAPASALTSTPALAYVEMDLEAILKPRAGFFGLSAIISPKSFLLDPNCRLTGGFAFNVWFDKNEDTGENHSGDFVVTLGGYHPAFIRPKHYPVVPRLGFNWPVDSHVNINGGVYFALTPSSIMAGGNLDATFHDGDLRAWFDAHADFLVQWKPLHYEADIGISVGAAYRLDLDLFSINFDVELGADLTLWGPPTGGKVHVDWFVISFTISFGAGHDQSTSAKLPWSEFKILLPAVDDKKVNTASRRLALTGAEGSDKKTLVNKIIIEQGLVRQEKDDLGRSVWVVRADECVLRTDSVIPLSDYAFHIINKEQNKDQIVFSGKAVDSVDIKPMQLTDVKSTHTVELMDESSHTPLPTEGWSVQVSTRNIPSALWGQSTGSNPTTPSAETLRGRWTGLYIHMPVSKPGSCLPKLNRKDSLGEYLWVQDKPLPLNIPAAPEPVITTPTDAISQLQKSIATTAITARDQMAQYLQKQGLFKLSPDSHLSTMERYAQGALDLLADNNSGHSQAKNHRSILISQT
jgi:hypothetical protein